MIVNYDDSSSSSSSESSGSGGDDGGGRTGGGKVITIKPNYAPPKGGEDQKKNYKIGKRDPKLKGRDQPINTLTAQPYTNQRTRKLFSNINQKKRKKIETTQKNRLKNQNLSPAANSGLVPTQLRTKRSNLPVEI